MSNLGKLVQKAFYLGMGLASVAADRASTELADLRQQAQKIADELVERGEMTAQDARDFVDNFVKRQMEQVGLDADTTTIDVRAEGDGPRTIEIDSEEGDIQREASSPPQTSATTPPSSTPSSTDTKNAVGKSPEELRQEIAALKAELDRLRKS